MTTQESLSLISASIALASLCANVFMGTALYKLNRRNLSQDEVLDTLRALRQRLEATRFFDIDPEQEIWEFGFESLKEVNLACATAIVITQGRRVPPDVRSAVEEMATEVKKLRAYQDSWRTFREGKTGSWRDVQKEWPDLGQATKSLQEAQQVVAGGKQALALYIAKP